MKRESTMFLKVKDIRDIEQKNLNMEHLINASRLELLNRNRELSHSVKEVELVKKNLEQTNQYLKEANHQMKLLQREYMHSETIATLGKVLHGFLEELSKPLERMFSVLDLSKREIKDFSKMLSATSYYFVLKTKVYLLVVV